MLWPPDLNPRFKLTRYLHLTKFILSCKKSDPTNPYGHFKLKEREQKLSEDCNGMKQSVDFLNKVNLFNLM